ncbi:hypothetical protein PS2_024244 [Malus domestica]
MTPCCCSFTSPTSISKFISESPHLSMLENQCTSMKDLQKIHAHLLKTGLANDTVAASRILAFSASPAGDINYACMVFRHIKEPNPFIWNTIIRGFSESQNPKTAISLFTELDPIDSCGYVLVSNIYAASSQFQEAIKERLSMKEQKIEKEPGCSLIKVDGEVHEFIAGGRLHQKAPEIYSLLDELGFMMPEME